MIEFSAQSQARMFSVFGLDHLSPVGLVSVLFALLGVFSILLLPLILRTVGPGDKDPAQLAWQKFLRRLKRAGFPHRASDGAMELAGSAAIHLPASAAEIYHIAGLYNRHRYSPDPPKPGEMKKAVQNFRPRKRADDVR